MVHDGPRSHIYYNAEVPYRNFEMEVEADDRVPLCNSGVYFHTTYLERGFPKKGFEVQIENTAPGQPGYGERKKTGSLYAVRNVYKPMVADNEWFRMSIIVVNKNVQVRVNGTLVVDYTETDPPYLPPGQGDRRLDTGTFALQGHDARAKATFRKIRVRRYPDAIEGVYRIPVADDTFKSLVDLATTNIPVVDYHAHLKPGLTLEQILAKGRRDGIQYGVAINAGKLSAANTDDALVSYVESMRGQPAYVAMQAEGREWTSMFSRRAVAMFDYVFTDAETWTDNHGKRMRLWMPEEVGAIPNVEEFMETLVNRTVGILENEPIDIFANPTFLPALIAADYDKRWTDERMMRRDLRRGARSRGDRAGLIAIACRPRNSSRCAKANGCKFFSLRHQQLFPPTTSDAAEYGIKMVEACKLGDRKFLCCPARPCRRRSIRKPEALPQLAVHVISPVPRVIPA